MSKIEWTGRTWNYIVGCSVVSPGCTHCYAMRQAARIERMSPDLAHYRGLTQPSKAGPVWTGKVACAGDEKLLEPLRRRKPTTYFVNSMSDLFHESVPDEWIDRVFRTIKQTPQHTYQILTKRAARMRGYMSDPATPKRVSYEGRGEWPPRNAWLGVSAEDQKRADERVPDLLATPAAVRFVSAEPLLGPVDFARIEVVPDRLDDRGSLKRCGIRLNALKGTSCESGLPYQSLWNGEGEPPTTPPPRLDWIIVGGESGGDARPMHPAWARAIRDQCAAAGVAFFFKQWGEWGDFDIRCDPSNPAVTLARPANDPLGRYVTPQGGSGIGPGTVWMRRVGKTRAGRLLDGRTHDDMPRRA